MSKSEDDITLGIFIGIGITLIVTIFAVWILFNGDDFDVISTHILGKRLCEKQGLIYDYRTLDDKIPTIYCKQNETEVFELVKITKDVNDGDRQTMEIFTRDKMVVNENEK